MAKKSYIGVNGKARKVKKIYVGVDGIARKVKKAYVGVGGIARPFWSGGVPSYYGKTPSGLSVAREINLQAASNGSYAFFAGGYSATGNVFSEVDAYDSSLVKVNAPSLSVARYFGGFGRLSSYAVFAGGETYTHSTNVAEAYSLDLTRVSLPNLSTVRGSGGSSSVLNNVFFAGGVSLATAEGYNSSLSRFSLPSLTSARYRIMGARVGTYGIFAGGYTGSSSSSNVEAYTTSLSKVVAPNLFNGGTNSGAATSCGANNEYAIFLGGYTPQARDVYTSNLVRLDTVSHVKFGNAFDSATSLSGYSIFQQRDKVVIYSPDLVSTILDITLDNVNMYHSGAVTVGDYALIGGGQTGGGKYVNDVYVFKI